MAGTDKALDQVAMHRFAILRFPHLIGLALIAASAGAQVKPKVLWIGGGIGSHNPAAMRDALVPVFEKAGMQVDYRTNESVLHADSLSRYDVMYIFNSKKGKVADGTPDLTQAQEDALYAWVRAGHAIIGVHSANSSYLGNPRYLDLFASKFTSHGDTAAYKYISIVKPDHPAMDGVSSPPAAGNAAYWDEGRLAQFTKTDTIMLATARGDGKLQPWTWVRPEGKGWVYYTSSGHDAKVWNDGNFQKQLVQALAWGISLNEPTAFFPHRNRMPSVLPASLRGAGSIRYYAITGAAVPGLYPALIRDAGTVGVKAVLVR
jgi:uncharacterized protein